MPDKELKPLSVSPPSFVQLRPLYELVKEVDCAGVKKLHLKRATEEYLSREDSCRCRPCQNRGQPLLVDSVCYCNCQDGTAGAACQIGTAAGLPAGKGTIQSVQPILVALIVTLAGAPVHAVPYQARSWSVTFLLRKV